MENAKKLIVRAFIPSTENPDMHIVHATGTEPLEVDVITSDQEELLHRLGERVLQGSHLAIDIQRSRKNVYDTHRKMTVNVSELQAKPVDPSRVVLSNDYKWSLR